MLPLELLKVIFGALSRNDLDALMLVNVSFRDIVLRDFAKEPLRYFEALNMYEKQSYTFVLPSTEDEYVCGDDDEFSVRMRHARLGRLSFSAVPVRGRPATNLLFDEDAFQLLQPHRDAWRDAHIITPCKFASASLYERAFSELLFCRSFLVAIDEHLNHRQTYIALPAFRECTFIRVFRAPLPLFAAEILDWLSVDAHSKQPKRLEIIYLHLCDSVENLVQRLKKDFTESKTVRSYVVEIAAGKSTCEGQLGRFVNRDASKVLTISRRTSGTGHFVNVKVEPMDQ